MSDQRLEFYDPLYETITFERGLPSNRGFLALREDPLNPLDIVQTAEFARLAFLRQAGLAWLVFPSATHTRFGHSIGCWWLGRIAESLIKVRGELGVVSQVRSLHSWLCATTLREEFYLSLLFHDVGHGPLSHVLERNRHFVDGLRGAGFSGNGTDHEYRGAALIAGEGPLHEVWRDLAPRRYGRESSFLSDIISRLVEGERKERVCVPSILYLITSDASYLDECTHEHREFLGVLHELVSGLLDLDRLDHYARDSYFSGVRQVSINVRGFLNNLCLSYDEDKHTHLSLTRDGASHAASLLFGKRQIISTMFRNGRTLALHAMINWALSAFLGDLPSSQRSRVCLEIALMEDDQLLELIGSSLHSGCKYVCQRIRCLRPYTCIGRWANVFQDEDGTIRENLSDYAGTLASDGSPSVLLHYDDDFWNKGRRSESRDWLDCGGLILEDTGHYLTDHPDYRDSFAHLQSFAKTKYMWVFVRDHQTSAKVREEIRQIVADNEFTL